MNTSLIEPYLFFGGRCEEALTFYRETLGAEVEMMMRFKESPDTGGPIPAGFEEKIMHASMRIGSSRVMLSDGNAEGATFAGFALSLALSTAAEVDRAFNALAEDGSVIMPLAQTFWSPQFGMLTDRFGITWMVSIASSTP